MEFKFKQQQYQADAARAVTEVFRGQRKHEGLSYLRDLGRATRDVRAGAATESMFTYAETAGGSEQGYANAPIELSSDQLLKNIHRVQRENSIMESASLFRERGMGACHLDVEMETGTGKTYVYTKTMLELNRLYGWTKFIVVVPSVAIREGVYKSMQTTDQHFHDQYGKSVKAFIYSSQRLGELDTFAQSTDVTCMIINMQAFNASMKEGGRSKESRIIFSERDDFGSRRPIDVVAATHPIVILDEPQKMGKKGSATQKGIAQFKPLFVLGYSATHREKHDLVYELDALDAYNQRLVKRIEVKGFELKNMRGTDGYLYLEDIVVSKSRAPEAVIEYKKMDATGRVRKVVGRFREGDDLYEETGATRLEAYKDYVIASGNDGVVPAQDGREGYVRFLNGEVLHVGEILHDSAQEDMQRVQIRETIRSHLEKEEALFRRDIKCLSLFFIDEVAKYRSPDGGTNGEYGRVFEEEYAACVEERLRELEDAGVPKSDPYVKYLRRDDPHKVHAGYFSIDKKGNAIDSKVKRGEEFSDDQDAYDLILKDKERLLSLDEPVRFIFSHSALREGWDNPNVFQICTLKESGSETSKRQEVGRGMRLCVNQQGERQDADVLGEADVQRVNLLTVVASESYKTFVEDLQKDIKSTLRDRPKSVEPDFFTGRDIVVEYDGSKVPVTFDRKQSSYVYNFLVKFDYIDDDGIPTDKFHTEVQEGSFVEYAVANLHEGVNDEPHAKAVQALVQGVYDPHALDDMISPARAKEKNSFNERNKNRREFQELWERINKKHAYTVEFDDEELRRHAIARIDKDLEVSEVEYTMITGEQKAQAERGELEGGESFSTTGTRTENVHLDAAAGTSVRYDLVGEVAQAACITRRSSAAILSGISPAKFELFQRNPEEFIAKCADLIREEKAAMVVEHIEYHEIDDEYDMGIFTDTMPEDASRAYKSTKGIQRYVFPDSDVERQLAEDMDAGDEVAVYAKLPRSFQIPTPVGNYAPDWAVAFKEGSVRHVYFVAETKGSMSTLQLKGVEKAKIECAEKLFEQMSTRDVVYHQVATYDDLLQAVRG